MSAKDLPKKGGFNKGVVIPLKFSCPKECVCNSSMAKSWYHKQCGKPSFISEYGNIFCENHLNECSGYFIKDASFQCNVAKKNNSWYQHKSMSQILMALVVAIQAAELNEDGADVQQLSKTLVEKILKRWNS